MNATIARRSHSTQLLRDDQTLNPTLKKPVFLIGTMRSGTTLTAELIGKFDGVTHCPFELKHIWSGVGRVPMASPRTGDHTCPCRTAADATPQMAHQLSRAFVQQMQGRPGYRENDVLLNKNPHLCNKLPFVDALFPDARYIWVHRSLHYVVASMKTLFEGGRARSGVWHHWPDGMNGATRCWHAHFNVRPFWLDRERVFPGGNLRYLCEYWLETNLASHRFMEFLPEDRRYSIRMEDLLDHTQLVLDCAQSFLRLPYRDTSWSKAVIEADRNGRWRSRLSDKEVDTIREFVAQHQAEIELIMGELPAMD